MQATTTLAAGMMAALSVSALLAQSPSLPKPSVPVDAAKLPPVMHFCAQHCLTFTLENGLFTNDTNLPGQQNVRRVFTVDSFTPASVVIRRTDTGSNPLTAVYTGLMSDDGNSLSGSGWKITWGAALNSIPGSDEERNSRQALPSTAVSPAPVLQSSPSTNPSAAQQTLQPLDIKEGVWEMTFTNRSPMTQDELDEAVKNVPPAQRAQTIASLKAASEKGGTVKRTVTLTRENIAKGIIVTPDYDCPKEIISSSNKVDLHFRCSQFDLAATVRRVDSEDFTSSATQTTPGGNPHIVEQTVVAKWTGEVPVKAQPAPAPDQPITARVTRQGNDYYSVVGNRSSAPLTGYAIAVVMYGSNQVNRHFYDLRMLGRPPIKPGAGVQEALRGIVVGAKPLAAVFADGSTFGDLKNVSDLMNRRNAKLTALAETASVLCDAEQKGLDKQSAIAVIESRSKALSEPTAMLSNIADAVFREALTKLKVAAPSREISIAEVLSGVQNAGAPLFEDSIKDPSGAPYLTVRRAQLFCGKTP